VIFLFAAAGGQPVCAVEPTLEELVTAGRYAEVPAPKKDEARAHAMWAFAQYHLAPGRAVAKAAEFADKNGDDLGTFVLMLCHRSGVGILRDRAAVLALNFDLRTKLEKKVTPTPLELYMLSRCQEGDRMGRTVN